MENVYFTSANAKIIELINEEFPLLPDKFLTRLFAIFHKLGNYEEESQKVRPTILITNNINAIIKAIPSAYKLDIYNDKDELSFERHVKSLMSFCNNEWLIFVSIKDGTYSYGICKTFNSIKEQNLIQIAFGTKKVIDVDKVSLICIDAVATGTVVVKGIKGKSVTVNFSINEDKKIDNEDVINAFVKDSLSKLKTTPKKLEEIATLQANIFKRALKNIHGTICVVVDRNYVDNGLFADGTWLQTPIDLSKLFIQTKNFSEIRLTNLAGLFIDMLNYDGITIMDNTGKIRAYNVFVQPDKNLSDKIVGGARKRAAYSILNSKNKKIVGVYFQSQDGDLFYENIKNYAKKQKSINK